MIDFTNVKSIVIPEGEVAVIARDDEILWQKYVAPSYTELEYIESTGTQWIDTGYSFSPNIEYEFSAMMTQVITNAAFLGQSTSWSWNNSGNSAVTFANASTGKLYGIYSNNGSVGTQTSSTYLNKRFTATFKNLSLSIDGVELQKFSQVTSWANEMPTMHIFNRNMVNGSQPTNGAYRFYYLKLYDNGILIRDFIPVLDTNDVPCMYDKVSGELFYNKGTGEFLYA